MTVYKVNFTNSANTAYGYDNTHVYTSKDAVSVKQGGDTEIDCLIEPPEIAPYVKFEERSSWWGGNVKWSPKVATTTPQSVGIHGSGTGEVLYEANCRLDAESMDEILIGVYKQHIEEVKVFYVSDLGDPDGTKPDTAPSDPQKEINDRWVQAVVKADVVQNEKLTVDYDEDGDGALDYTGPERTYLLLEVSQAIGIDWSDKKRPWIIYVKDFSGTDAYGYYDPYVDVAFIRCRRSGETNDFGITTAHEFGHAIGCGHVEVDSVMRAPGFSQSDLISYRNWGQVERD